MVKMPHFLHVNTDRFLFGSHITKQNILKMHPAVLSTTFKTAGNSKG